MNYLTENDIDYLSDKSTSNLNMVLYGMTSLMEDTQEKVELLESQTWFQRMANTITGKNKMTVEEISHNHEKINAYMSEAIAELYNRDCIDHDIILGLGNRLNDLFAAQVELKQMLGAFVNKLNQKIISIDNFHMLTTEINQGVYNDVNPIVSICKIMSQLDMRTIQDKRKMDILIRAMQESNILSDLDILLSELLCNILYVSEAEAGTIAMMLVHIQDEYLAEVVCDVLEEYYFLPEKVRKMKSREAVVKKVLQNKQIDVEYAISPREFYDTLIDAIAEHIVQYEMQEIEDNYKNKYQKLMDYFDQSLEFIEFLRRIDDSWEPVHGEWSSNSTKREYFDFMNKVIDNLDVNSLIGSNLKGNASNIGYFFQSVLKKFQTLNETIVNVERKDVRINDSGYLYLTDYNSFKDNEFELRYFSLWNYFEMFLIKPMQNSRELYSFGEYDSRSSNYVLSLSHKFGMSAFWQYYRTLGIKIVDMIGNDYSNYDEIYELAERYPINFELQQYNSSFINHFKLKEPCIKFYWTQNGMEMEAFNQAEIMCYGEGFEVIVEVLGIDSYTLSYTVLKNTTSEMDMASWSQIQKKLYNIQWGERPGKCKHRLVFVPNGAAYMFNELELKVYIKDKPSCCGIISCSM